MKSLFDQVANSCSKIVTHSYSTSFSIATKLLAPSIRQDIYNIYGFVRFADEIVDTFHDYDKATLFQKFKADLHDAISQKISLNPILNSFQATVHQYNIDTELYEAFMDSMEKDLYKSNYLTQEEYETYIYYSKLLQKLKKTPSLEIKNKRIRVPNYQKASLLAKSYISCRFNLV